MNPTAEKFGYPDSAVKSFEHWHVLVRPAQPTVGSLVLVCSDPTDHFGGI
ncbi:MAG: HIT family protein, partial [Deltaproteobacteria bacterium]|nr:HIT family protein [Deltaproteobacteria bacterium]